MHFLSNFALWFILFTTLGRFQELFPFLIPFRLGLLSIALGAIVVLSINAKDLFILVRKTPIKNYIILISIIAFLGIPFSVYKSDAINEYIDLLRILLATSIVIALGKNNLKSMQLCLISILFVISNQMILQTMGGRISVSLTYDPNDIALLCVVYLPFAIYGITHKNFIIKCFSIVTAGGGIASIALSASRGGLLALVVISLYGIILAKKRRMLLISICVIGSFVFAAMAGDVLWERIQAIIDGTDYNFATEGDSRMSIWEKAFELMMRRPILGVGIGQFTTGMGMLTDGPWKTAHNSFLQIGLELGLGGLYAFCGILYSIYRISTRGSQASFFTANEQLGYTFLRISLIGLCVGGALVSHAYSQITYTLIAVGAIMFLELEKREKLAEEEQELTQVKKEESIEDGGEEYSKKPDVPKNLKGLSKQAQINRTNKQSRLAAGDILRKNSDL